MGVPSPAVASFTDGTIVHQADLNSLGTNITNLYNYCNGGFRTQRDCCIASQTSTQNITNATDTLARLDTATVNTNNMYVASQNTQLTIQTAGVYWVFAQVRWPPTAGGSFTTGFFPSILANGTSATANAIATSSIPILNTGAGCTNEIGVIVNLAVGATLYLNIWQNSGATVATQTNFGGTYLGAVFLTPAS